MTQESSPSHAGTLVVPAGAAARSRELTTAIEQLQGALRHAVFPYSLPQRQSREAAARALSDQIGDYILPRVASLDAPLVAVVGGSTGAGKSTLVSSLVGTVVARSSAIRPTTRRPLLLHAPGDEAWFSDDRVLGSLARVRVAPDAPPSETTEHTPREVEIRAAASLPPGLALIDAPDVDSIVDDNRALAHTLLSGADLWIFVTTAARYADAVPWEHLREAASRDIMVAVVLDRIPPGAREDVSADLRRRLDQSGLEQAPLLCVDESPLDERGLLPEASVAPVREWLNSIARDAASRQAVATRTLVGAVQSLLRSSAQVGVHVRSQDHAREELAHAISESQEEALSRIDTAMLDGSMLRGEVMARWQEYVGTGDLLRGLDSRISLVRDRITAALTGKPAPAARVEEALGDVLVSLAVSESQRAADRVSADWQRMATADEQLRAAAGSQMTTEELRERASSIVSDWEHDLLDMIRSEGSDKRLTARLLSLGVNGIGVALMIVVFAHTGGLTGSEMGIAGGAAVVAQRLLEGVFGDQAMRQMASHARERLREHLAEMVADYLEPLRAVLEPPAPPADELDSLCARVQAAAQALTPAGTVTPPGMVTPPGTDGHVHSPEGGE